MEISSKWKNKYFGHIKQLASACRLYIPANIQLRRIRWAKNIVNVARKVIAYTFQIGKTETDQSEYLATDGRILLKFVLRKWFGSVCIGFFWFMTGAIGLDP
jgi:hypothetical protein